MFIYVIDSFFKVIAPKCTNKIFTTKFESYKNFSCSLEHSQTINKQPKTTPLEWRAYMNILRLLYILLAQSLTWILLFFKSQKLSKSII